MSTFDLNNGLDGVALVGIAGRFPGARNVAEFWRHLQSGVETITRFEPGTLEHSVLEDPAAASDPNYVPARGILEGVDLFDAEFFGVNPREADVLDPQQRLFLEAAWEALEDAGYDPRATNGSIGVFAGMSNNTYFPANIQGRRNVIDLVGALQTMMANEKDYLATRVSYKLDLKGPSVSIQTACSTSLVAVCQAVQSLQSYQCDMALAGGVSISLPQRRGYLPYDGSITSPDGHCRAFDARAQGTVFSNGLGIVVLKRLADAVGDRDHIYAVIKGTAINNDGSSKVSFLAPSVDGHTDAVVMAQAVARVDPRSVSYIEAHGTGTALGDVVEVTALTSAFRLQTSDTGFCALGSVKTNIGHLDAAAGVAGLIKAALALQHRLIPPTLHYTTPNPKLGLEKTPFFVNTVPLKWAAGPTPRRAGVSSLGAGGTNAHVVLEEAPEQQASDAGRGIELVVLSARTATALDRASDNLRAYLEQGIARSLADVAYTLQVGRRHFSHRRALVCRSREDAARLLIERPAHRLFTGSQSPVDLNVAFVFPDDAPGVRGAGRALYERDPVFRSALDECARVFHSLLDADVAALIYPASGPADESRLATAAYRHAALFAVEYALARMWQHWGIKPGIVAGHGVGQLVAAHVSGVLTLPDAASLLVRRAKLVNKPHTLEGEAAFDAAIRAIARRAPEIELAARGARITADQVSDPGYWVKSLLLSNESGDALAGLTLPAPTVALMVGPAGRPAGARGSVTVLPTLAGDGRDVESNVETLAQLWVRGVDADWRAIHDAERRTRVPLPTYPFERERYWIDAVPAAVSQRSQADLAEAPQLAGASVASRLVTIFSERSGLDEGRLDPAVNFFELGLDSLFLTQAVSSIKTAFGVTVTFRELLEELSTIESLAASIAERLPQTAGQSTAAPPAPIGPVAVNIDERGERPAREDARPRTREGAAPQSSSTGFGPYRPVDKSSTSGLTEHQRRHLESFIERYTARTTASKRSTATSRDRLADPRSVAGFRSMWKELVYPIVVARSAGSRLWDVDGNEYIDLVNGFGTNLFGHSPSFVVEAIQAQLKRGYEIGPQSMLAGPVASRIADMTGHERVAFCNTGSEAVSAAIRTARTVSGRKTIAMFAGAYHGTFDEVLVRGTTVRGEARSVPIAPGIPESACDNVLVLEYGAQSALDVLRARGHELAALLVEPVQSRRPDLQPVEFLQRARQLTADSGTALVFDEVVSGFRVHQGGVQTLFDIRPDIATYGKVVGGGLPIGVVAGRSEYLDALDGGRWEYGDDSFPEVGMTFFAGTFVRHPLALAAACAVMDHLKTEGPELQRRLNLRATGLVDNLQARAAELNAPVSITHFSSWFCFNVPGHLPLASLFFQFMRSKGIHIWEGRPGFISTAHTDEDLTRIVDAFGETIVEMQQAGFLPSEAQDAPPVPGARRGTRPDGRESWFVSDPDRPGRYLEVGIA
jgi:acyl transferase domain-containing protein/glutamate-1-semialdehyde aminotransferase